MKNIDLNPGGLIGALLCGGAVAVLSFSRLHTAEDSGSGRLVVVAVVGGAFAGNFLWEKVRKRSK